MKSLFLALTLSLTLGLSGCVSFKNAQSARIAIQVATWEYIGDDLSRRFEFVKQLGKLKTLIDLRKVSLLDVKGELIARINAADLDQSRRLSLLAVVSSLEIEIKNIEDFDESQAFVTVNNYIDYSIQAAELL